MRRYFWIMLVALAPIVGYECVEKCAEALPVSGGLLALSLRAEHETRWTLRGPGSLFDRTRHELAESRHFYALTGSMLRERLLG